MPTISMGKLENYSFFKEHNGVTGSAPLLSIKETISALVDAESFRAGVLSRFKPSGGLVVTETH